MSDDLAQRNAYPRRRFVQERAKLPYISPELARIRERLIERGDAGFVSELENARV